MRRSHRLPTQCRRELGALVEVADLRLGRGPVSVVAPVRVVYVIDEARQRGFAYGTLPGHPERGEEAFTVTWANDDTVSFRVSALSKPASRLARIGGPFASAVQRRITERYLRSI